MAADNRVQERAVVRAVSCFGGYSMGWTADKLGSNHSPRTAMPTCRRVNRAIFLLATNQPLVTYPPALRRGWPAHAHHPAGFAPPVSPRLAFTRLRKGHKGVGIPWQTVERNHLGDLAIQLTYAGGRFARINHLALSDTVTQGARSGSTMMVNRASPYTLLDRHP